MASDISTTLHQVTAWPVQDQLELMNKMWDHLIDSGWRPEITEEQKAEFDRRLDALDANPQDVVTWERIVEQVRRPR